MQNSPVIKELDCLHLHPSFTTYWLYNRQILTLCVPPFSHLSNRDIDRIITSINIFKTFRTAPDVE